MQRISSTRNMGQMTAGSLEGIIFRGKTPGGATIVEIDGTAAVPYIWLRANDTDPGEIKFGSIGSLYAANSYIQLGQVSGLLANTIRESIAVGQSTVSVSAYGGTPGYQAELQITSSGSGGALYLMMGGSTVMTVEKTASGIACGFFGSGSVLQPTVLTGNANGEIGGLTISNPPTQAEVQALRDKCEELADDLRSIRSALTLLKLVAT